MSDYLEPQPAMGRTYYLSLPTDLDSEKLTQTIWNLQELLENGKKVRILWDEKCENSSNFEPNFEPIIKNTLEKLKAKKLPNLSVKDYKTIFYLVKKEEITKQIEEYSVVNWQNYKDFEYQKIPPNSPEIRVVENFFLNSNGSDFVQINGKTEVRPNSEIQKEILKQLPTAFQSETNSIFLVSKKSKNSLEYVGAFSLLQVNLNEIQLHYTSGKSTLDNIYTGKKMPILMAAMLDLFQNPIYKDTQILTFSNKDPVVSKIYQSLGFKVFANRKCIIVKNNLQESDLK